VCAVLAEARSFTAIVGLNCDRGITRERLLNPGRWSFSGEGGPGEAARPDRIDEWL
jgi:hypothetical protein